MNEKELIEKEAEKMRVTLKARLLPNLPLDENEPLLKPRTHVTKIINTMEFDWHLNEMFKAGQDNVTEIVTNLFEREDYKLGFKAGQLNPPKTCVVCMKDVSDGSININFPNTLGIKKGLPFCSMECEDVVNGMIKANKDEGYKAGQESGFELEQQAIVDCHEVVCKAKIEAQQYTEKLIDNTFNNWHIKFLNDFEPKTESKEIINWWCNIQDRIEELKLKLVLKNEF